MFLEKTHVVFLTSSSCFGLILFIQKILFSSLACTLQFSLNLFHSKNSVLFSFFCRYSCFYCDFDLCLECKNIWEERRQYRRQKAEKKLRKRGSKLDVANVVCLKTLCDKVAQLEQLKHLKVKQIKCNLPEDLRMH